LSLRLVWVTHAYPRWDGDVAGAFLERLAVALRARGHSLRVLAPAEEGRGGDEERHGVTVTRVRYAAPRRETLAYRGTMTRALRSPAGILAFLGLVRAQARAVRAATPDADIVHAHWWVPGGVAAWRAHSARGAPYVVTLHGTDVALLDRSPLAGALARRVLRGAAGLTAVSSFLAARAARAARIDARRIAVQPMPVEVERFSRLATGGGGVFTVGRLSAQKRLDVLIEAVAELRRRGTLVPLTIVGDGPERAALERRAQELGVAYQLTFTGAVRPDAIPATLAGADVFAFPAEGEGLGLAAAEALMLGIPVVAAQDGGGVTDIVPPQGAGLLVPGGDPAVLAWGIGQLLADGDARRRAAEAGAALRERLDPRAVAGAFESVYERALEGRRA